MLTERRDYWTPGEDGKAVRIAIGVAVTLEDDELGLCDEHLQQAGHTLLREYGDETDSILDLENIKLKRLTERVVLMMAKVDYQR